MTKGFPYFILPHFDQETQKYNAKCSSYCTWMYFPCLLLLLQYLWQRNSWSCPSKTIRNQIRRHLAVKALLDTHPLPTALPSPPATVHTICSSESAYYAAVGFFPFIASTVDGATRSPINRATRPRATISLVGRVSWQGEPPYLRTFSGSAPQ